MKQIYAAKLEPMARRHLTPFRLNSSEITEGRHQHPLAKQLSYRDWLHLRSYQYADSILRVHIEQEETQRMRRDLVIPPFYLPEFPLEPFDTVIQVPPRVFFVQKDASLKS